MNECYVIKITKLNVNFRRKEYRFNFLDFVCRLSSSRLRIEGATIVEFRGGRRERGRRRTGASQRVYIDGRGSWKYRRHYPLIKYITENLSRPVN